MSTSYSSTNTYSHTVADVEKVMLNVRADLLMIADSTKAMSRTKAEEYAHDIELMAKNDYLASVDVTLLDVLGNEIKATRYFVKTGEEANGASRPGGVRWPETPSGSVRIIMKTTDSYKTDVAKISKLPWKISWGPAADDTSHSSLSTSGGREYSSNGYGATRSDFT